MYSPRKFNILLILIGLSLPAIHGASVLNARNANELNLAKLLADARALSPQQQKACSDYYFPLMEEISKAYESGLQECSEMATQGYQLAQAAIMPYLYSIRNSSEETCNDFYYQCGYNNSYDNNPIEYLDCYGQVAAEKVEVLFSMSGNATLASNMLKMDYDRIASDELKCQAIVYEDYQQKWNAKASDWNQCVAGKGTPPPTETTTTAQYTSSATPPTAPEPTAFPTSAQSAQL